MGVFDALVIQAPPGVPDVQIQRPSGPLERGHLDDSGTWIPATDPQRLDVPNFGIDATGRPYYDTDGAAAGEEAFVWIDAAGSLISAYQAAVLADRPVLYLRLSERSGAVAVDASGRAHNGTYVGSPILGQPGVTADGDSAVDFHASGYVTVPDTPDLRITGDLTLEAWTRPASRTVNQWLIAKTVSGNGQPYEWRLENTSGLPRLGINGNGLEADNPAPLDARSHLAVTYTLATQTVAHYLNGAPNGSGVVAPTTDGGGALRIGTRDDLASLFSGLIDEPAVYDTALAPGRLLAHYQAAKTRTAPRAWLEAA